MSSSKSVVRGRPPVVRTQVLLALREQKAATASELGTSAAYLSSLVKKGVVERCGRINGPGRGRPQTQFKLSKSGQGVALNLHRSIAKSVQAIESAAPTDIEALSKAVNEVVGEVVAEQVEAIA